MKKLTLLALCIAAVGSMSAQKSAVDQAKALSGKFDKLEEARTLIGQALENPETANQAGTYFIAGKIEFDAYDNGLKNGMINPQDPSADPIAMGQELLKGYNYFLKALPLDSIPNEKGQIKPKHSKEIISKISGHTGDFFNNGAKLYEAKKYYPEAYESFFIYGDMPEIMKRLGAKPVELDSANRGQAYFNAGLAAYSGNEPVKSADAFRAARNMGYKDVNAYIYEIACWQAVSQRDSTMNDIAKDRIMSVARDGNALFGMEQPIFLNNMINSMVQDGQLKESIDEINSLMQRYPDNADLYGLRGFVYNRMDNDDQSVADYVKAASLPGVSYEILKTGAAKLYRVGTQKYNELDQTDREGRMALKAKYFEPAKAMADKAKAMPEKDGDIDYLLESIDYALDSHFK